VRVFTLSSGPFGWSRSQHNKRPTSPWRLIGYEMAAAALLAAMIALVTTALDFAGSRPSVVRPPVLNDAGAFALAAVLVLALVVIFYILRHRVTIRLR
jgi:hypothetical protein